MKKVILALLLSFLLISIVYPAQAAVQKTIRIPAILQGATESIQKAIDTLTNKTDSHEVRIAELEKKVKALEEKVAKLESKSVSNDGISNTQQSQSLKENSGVIPQPDSSLNQKLNEFLGASSSKVSADDFIVSNAPKIENLGEVKLK